MEKQQRNASRRWFQFTLGSVLLIVTILGCVFAYLSSVSRQAARQRNAISAEAARQRVVTSELALAGAVIRFEPLGAGTPEIFDTTKLSRARTVRWDLAEVEDISPLAEMPNLREIDLSNSSVTDVSPLAGMKRLEVLDLRGTPVTNLTPLHGLVKLKLAWVPQTVSETQIAALRAALPDADIYRQ